MRDTCITRDSTLLWSLPDKFSPEGWFMLVIKSDVLRQGSKRNARDIQDIIVADDGYGAPKMDGKGTKIERT